MSRAYTVAELDALRRVLENRYLFGSYTGPPNGNGMSRTYREEEKVKAVEEAVRTAMIAGHTAEDYLASELPNPPTVTQRLQNAQKAE